MNVWGLKTVFNVFSICEISIMLKKLKNAKFYITKVVLSGSILYYCKTHSIFLCLPLVGLMLGQ